MSEKLRADLREVAKLIEKNMPPGAGFAAFVCLEEQVCYVSNGAREDCTRMLVEWLERTMAAPPAHDADGAIDRIAFERQVATVGATIGLQVGVVLFGFPLLVPGNLAWWTNRKDAREIVAVTLKTWRGVS